MPELRRGRVIITPDEMKRIVQSRIGMKVGGVVSVSENLNKPDHIDVVFDSDELPLVKLPGYNHQPNHVPIVAAKSKKVQPQ